METDKFDIILTVWNRVEYTKRTIASLIQSGAHQACERLIVVDNHSTEEGMSEFLADLASYQKVFVLRRPTNDGWGTAVNDALGMSRAENLLIVNNDVEFTPNFWETMFSALRSTYNVSHGRTINGFGIIAGWKHTAHGFVSPDIGGVHNEWFDEMDNVPAVAWLIPKRAMMVVGMLPENGPCFTKGGNGEDTTFVNKMKAGGFLTGATRADVATHLDGY